MNQFNCTGNLGGDPEVYTFGDGNKKVTFQLAISDDYKDKNGEWIPRTQWATFEAFRHQATKISEWEKGYNVRITAKFKQISFESEGQTKYKTIFEVQESELLKKPKAF